MKLSDYLTIRQGAELLPASGVRIKPILQGGHITQYRVFDPQGGELVQNAEDGESPIGEYVWLDAEVVSPDAPDIEPMQPGQAP